MYHIYIYIYMATHTHWCRWRVKQTLGSNFMTESCERLEFHAAQTGDFVVLLSHMFTPSPPQMASIASWSELIKVCRLPYMDHIWPFMAHIWTYMDHIWPYMDHIWPYVYGPYRAIYGHISPYMVHI